MTRAKGKKMPQTSHVKKTLYVRGVKLVRPECQVLVNQMLRDKAYPEYTTGPCQQAVRDNPRTRFSWFKTCTHGPELFEDGTPIPENLRPYYEAVITKVQQPIVEEGVVTDWKDVISYKVQPRVRDVAWHPNMSSGRAHLIAQQQGAKPLSDFDIAPFCEMKGCFRQDSTLPDGTEKDELTQYKNGLFCSEMHAKLIKATESGQILHLDWDAGRDRPISTERRREELARIEV